MRVVLVGRIGDRDRVRAGLIDAGIDIVAESAVAPAPDSVSPAFDAIVTAAPGADDDDALARRASLDFQESLTPRELEVLARLAEGQPNKSIAHALGISDQTVKFHVAAIIAKLGATNRTDAVRRAIRRGLVAI